MLAGDRRAALGDVSEARDVEFGVAQRPQHADTDGVGEQGERHDCSVDFDTDGRIIRESACELWRRANAALADDIPADAQTIPFD